MSESCASCRFYLPSAARGVCRRRPPVWTGPDDSHDEGLFAFPSVHPTSWCGEYEHGEVQSMLQAEAFLTEEERSVLEVCATHWQTAPAAKIIRALIERLG
jgi:hypothetical protein